ncbi:protein kinase [Streptomyces sp. NRRL B-3648]|uniref:protein kinase n=1 Tax=Streptomyces sp. NRRL B-3648 TaxID=1519493 RepID=UPI0006C09FC0|nr:protein kinase [Streptomyces sp. NRRL B-3648]KOV95235.1 serine/threonine protein kinase [Streptomyces sp. NRRL B-3648]
MTNRAAGGGAVDDYAGRVLADRYRLPLPPSDEYELTETRAFDTYSGQEVIVRQVPLPEVVEAEVLDAEGLPEGFTARQRGRRAPEARAATRQPADPAVRRAVEAAQAAAGIPDHPRLDQVFDVFAEGGSLWIVSERVAARPLAALLAQQPLSPYRAAEVASDVLMALRVLHAHGWVHRNITARTVLVCDDGRVMLTGLAAGAAEEALCGYDPVPAPEDPDGGGEPDSAGGPVGSGPGTWATGVPGEPAGDLDPEAARRAAIQARAAGGLPAPDPDGPSGPAGQPALESGADIRAARAGAIAAYRAGARAAARVHEAQQGEHAALPGARPFAEGDSGAEPDPYSSRIREARQNGRAALPGARSPAEGDSGGAGPDEGASVYPYAPEPGSAGPPGRTADPYGVRGAPWHGAGPRPGAGATPPALGGGARRPGLPATDPRPGHTLVPGQGHAPVPGRDHAPGAEPASGAGRQGAGPAVPAQAGGRWDEPGAVRRGPGTALAAERARQVRMTVVGPVTERWAPEQAGPVHENWQLAAPIGPATDLWALGALLFRAVQGHAPYPEESTAELVQLVCAEPPAFAEECGPLRPVVESLLRQDPTERPDVEELSGWLRSLVRSAPEPDAGTHVVPVPPADPRRLPIVRRRGELVRRRRAGLPAAHPHGRHKRAREGARSPRSLGRTLLLLILLLLAGAIAYAMLFMPEQGADGAAGGDRTGGAGQASTAPSHTGQPSGGPSAPDGDATASAPATETQTGGDPSVPDGFTLRKDPDGFRIAVAEGWDRIPKNGSGQVVYAHGNFELIVVPGRDGTSAYGSDPMVYQRDKERELQPYRDSSWATASGLRTIEVGGRTMAEGQFTWTDGQGRDLFVRNMALLLDGRYHIVQVRGPEAERDEVTRLYEQATATYRHTG